MSDESIIAFLGVVTALIVLITAVLKLVYAQRKAAIDRGAEYSMAVDCGFCRGSGEKFRGVDCDSCNGYGKVMVRPGTPECGPCRGSGHSSRDVRCPKCDGTGWVDHMKLPKK